MAGAVFLTACFFGLHSLNMSLYQAAAFYFAVWLISFTWWLIPFNPDIQVLRHLPSYATVGQTLTYDIELINHSEKIQKGLVLYELVADPRPDYESFINSREPFEDKRNFWDRRTLYYRWVWLVNRQRRARIFPVSLPNLPPKKSIRVKVSCRALSRGYLNLSHTLIARPDVLGLINRIKKIACRDRLLITPEPREVASLSLKAARQHHPGGVLLASSIGNSDEFMSLRNYRPGDPMRNIHWRSFAKMREPIIKEFEDEFFIHQLLVLDTCTDPKDDLLLEEAVKLAVGCTRLLDQTESIFELMMAGKPVRCVTAGRSLGQDFGLMEALSCVHSCRSRSIDVLLSELTRRLGRLSGAVCIFLGWSPAHFSVYQRLRQADLLVQVLVLSHDPGRTREKIQQDTDDLSGFEVLMAGPDKSKVEK